MRLYLQILFFLLIEIVVAIYIYYFSGYRLENIYEQPPMFLLPPLYAFLFAFLIGYVKSILVREKKLTTSNYRFGLVSSFIVYVLVGLIIYIKTSRYNQLFGYNAENQLL